jgi:hypothetical protein
MKLLMKGLAIFLALIVILMGIGIYRILFEVIRPAMDQDTIGSSFSIQYAGTIKANSPTKFEAANDQGKFCFTSGNSGEELCSIPAPRPGNTVAHSLQGELSVGTWKVTTASDYTYVLSEAPLSHNNNNRGGFIGMCAIFGLIYLFIFIPLTQLFILNFKKEKVTTP